MKVTSDTWQFVDDVLWTESQQNMSPEQFGEDTDNDDDEPEEAQEEMKRRNAMLCWY